MLKTLQNRDIDVECWECCRIRWDRDAGCRIRQDKGAGF